MRLHVPPRDVASLVILRAITRAGWAVAGVLLIATMIIVFDVLAAAGRWEAALTPIGFLAAQLAALVLLYLRPRPRTAVLYIGVSLICIAGYQFALFAEPSIADGAPFLFNRPIVALCAIGAVTAVAAAGIWWTTAAFLLGEFTSVAVQLALGRELIFGLGPLLAYSLVLVLLLWLWRNWRQGRKVPDFRSVDAETRRLQQERDAETRVAAVVHDTVLSDLAAIVHGRVVLTEYDRQHLRANVARLQAAMSGDSDVAPVSGSVDLELLRIVGDLQWRGMSVELSGDSSALVLLSSPARTAALNAVAAALENVLKHAGTTSADLFIDEGADEVMVMVVDQGCGYDAAAVGSDRLGLRLSIVRRVEDCGGRAKLWSEPGVGTSVILFLPKAGRRLDGVA